jgi:flavin-dependent dehydrogenase
MAMAMHAGVLASTLAAAYCAGKITRERLEKEYNLNWQRAFSQRLRHGRRVQKLFGHDLLSQVAVNLALYCRPIAKAIVRNTHGEVF